MKARTCLWIAILAGISLAVGGDAFGRGGGGGGGGRGGGGFGGGGGDRGGGGNFDRGGGGGFGGSGSSVRYSGHDWQGDSGASRSVEGGGGGYTSHSADYGSIRQSPAASGGGAETRGGWVAGPAGGGAAAVQGPRGGEAAAVQGPRGGEAAAAQGPHGSEAAAYKTPAGGRGAVVSGPGGRTAAAAQGAHGGEVAGVRGPNGGAVTALPSGYRATNWHGQQYYHNGNNFYRPYWYGGAVCYWPVAAPVGWFFPSLPAGAIQYNNYYYSDGTYYQPAQQDGQQGYAVAEPPAGSETPDQPQPPSQFAASVPDPFQTLQAMCDYLGKQQNMTFSLSETYDDISSTGQKVQVSSERNIWIQRPDKMAVDFQGEGHRRRVVYDGKNVMVADLVKNVYGQTPMTGPVDTVLDKLAKEHGIALAIGDLLSSDAYKDTVKNVQAGQYVGEETIGGKVCDHLAFKQANSSWEIWIQQGKTPVVSKLVITHTQLAGQPRYAFEVTAWNTTAIPATVFNAEPPKGAQKIDMLPLPNAGATPR